MLTLAIGDNIYSDTCDCYWLDSNTSDNWTKQQ